LKGKTLAFAKIEEAVAAIARGEMVVVVDDHDRENEGDIVFAAVAATPEKIAFMMNNARGLICVAMEKERLDALDIPLMVVNNTESMKTAFTVSVDYVHGTTTGISAPDRSATVRALIDQTSRPTDFARPGHIFPLRANPQGVLARPGHTEAAVDLCKLAGLPPAGVICEVANDDGTMSRLHDLEGFANRHGLLLIAIEDLISHIRHSAKMPADRTLSGQESGAMKQAC
jgi:3,4-dihydroxy 2-butanone 4-phosphate synthase